MKKTKLLAALLAVMCVFAFSACGASFDPVAYVQGNFDAVFHGDITDEFVSTLGDVDSAEEYQEEYNDLLETTTEGILTSMGIFDPTEALKADTRDMFVNILDATKYEVSSEYTEDEEGNYYVEVTIYPLLTYMEVCLDEDGTITAAAEAKVTADMTYDEIMIIVVEEMIAEVNAALANPEYGEAQTYEIYVYADEDGYYTADEDQIAEISAALMGA